MLESSGFDFRVRYPQRHLIKLAKEARIHKDVASVAYDMMIDLYRTFAPLKQTCSAMAFACIELATILCEKQQSAIRGSNSPRYSLWRTTRAEILETILDLVDLYTHFPKLSTIGPLYPIEKFIQIRIQINQEIEASHLKRYTEYLDPPKTNGIKTNIVTPKTPITPASPSDARTNGRDIMSPDTLSPRSSTSGKRARPQDGTIRFMLDAEKARSDKEISAEYFKVEYEEYEVEVEEPIPAKMERHDRGPHLPGRNGRDDRFFNNKPRFNNRR